MLDSYSNISGLEDSGRPLAGARVMLSGSFNPLHQGHIELLKGMKFLLLPIEAD